MRSADSVLGGIQARRIAKELRSSDPSEAHDLPPFMIRHQAPPACTWLPLP